MLRGNKLLLALLLPIFVLAFCFAAFALDEEDIIIIDGEHFTPDEWAAKQAEAAQKTYVEGDVQQQGGITAVNPVFDIDKETVMGMDVKPRMANAPTRKPLIPAPTPNIFFEDFEVSVPPAGWDYVQTNATSTWQIDSYDPWSGIWSVACFRAADPGPYDQDEWLITPSIDLSAKSSYNWFLEFYWYGQYTYMVTNNTQDFEVWISTDGGTNFTTKLWDETTDGVFTTWAWNKADIDLSAYLTETNVCFGFRTVGTSPAEVGFDWVTVRAPAVGRCCFGDPTMPSCADETEADCLAHADFLSWDESLDCTTPCPAAGFGDNCTNPITATFPADFVSSQWVDNNYTCGRVDDYDATCMNYYDGGEDIVYEFTATEDIYVNITVDPKGTTYAGFSVNTGCPPNDCFINVANSYLSTPFGANNVILPAGTYYLMIDTWPSPDCIPDFDLTIEYLGPPPPPPANDDCADAIAITIPSTVSGTQVGATVDCPGLLDWNAVWYIFDLNTPSDCNNVEVDYASTPGAIYTVGVIFMDDCACDDYILYTAIDWGYDGYHPLITWKGLPNGTYYFPVYAVDAGDGPMDFVFDISSAECPPAPDNDDCSGALPITLGTPTPGSTAGATPDCPSLFTDWYGVWYYFTLSSSTNCNNVSASYCASLTGSPGSVSATLIAENSEPDCCDAASQFFYTSGAFDCPNGWPQIYWDGIPDGTYYYIVAFPDGVNEYDFVLTMDAVECPPPEPGDNCSDPLKITISGSGDLPYVDNNYTCGRGNFSSATCLSSYDGGEDIFYEVTVNTPMTLKFILDPQGTTWTGMALGAACPPPGTTYTNCLAEVHSSSGTPKSFMYDAAPGTYYLMIDTYPAPDCIPSFTLTIEEFIPTPGDNCSDPIKVNLPSDSPFEDLGQYTCGRTNNYSNTCMSYYDGGEDIHYEVNVDEAGYYEFMMDPLGTTWTGMALGAACPPPGTTYTDCIAEVTDYSSAPHGFVVYLTPATYYLMIDTWPSPTCIPAFDLYINYLAPPLLTWDKTLIEFCNVQAGDNGCQTLNLGNLGDIGLDYSISIEYGIPPVKEIDGANIVPNPALYTPGATADILFTCTNASSDAEWIDSIAITFPAGVTVNSATDFVVVSGGGTYCDWDGTTGDNVTVSWGNWNGGYGNIYSTSVAEATVNITFDGSLSGPINLNYHLSGDIFGSPPHDIDLVMTLEEDNPLTSWLSASPASATVAPGGNQAVNVCYTTAGLPEDTYFATLIITHNGGLSPIMIPVTMTMGDDHQPAAMILIDRSGSMALEDAFGDSRLLRAKALAHTDADDLLGMGYQVAVMAMNETFGMVMMTDFSTDPTTVHDAIDNIVDPRHDTPLAAAMCEAHCHLAALGCGIDALYTYTDGLENCSLEFTMCHMCDYCYRYTDTGWNFDCDPNNPASCTDWQLCLAEVFSMNAMTTVNYFGSPINPFTKGVTPPEDLYFLKYTADASDGEFNYFADAAFVPGDANGDGSINVSDAVFIINYVFVAGQAPSPLEAGDANCDSSVNVSDAVYLINYIFVSGPAPNNCQ